MQTSISDYDQYKNACLEAATNNEKFSTFKRNSYYREILEHTDYETGKHYANSILKSNFNFDKLSLLKSNDTQGSAEIAEYPAPFGYISPSTLYYIKILTDLEEMFGSLDGMNIVEIGVGYGGQCKIISDYFKPASYTLVDLAEPLALAKRYHRDYRYENINYLTQDKLSSDTSYDLLISNYAFSECARPVQLDYINKIITKSRKGYILYNDISNRFGIDSLSKEEFTTSVTCSEKPEEPLTGVNNCILYW